VKIFADTGFLVGLWCRRDGLHNAATDVWQYLRDQRLISGLSDVIVTNYVVVEAFKLIQSVSGCDKATGFWEQVTSECDIKWATKETVRKAIVDKLAFHRNSRTGEPPIGLVDAISIVFMDSAHIRVIISYDEGYDSFPFVNRIHDRDSVDRLAQSWYRF